MAGYCVRVRDGGGCVSCGIPTFGQVDGVPTCLDCYDGESDKRDLLIRALTAQAWAVACCTCADEIRGGR